MLELLLLKLLLVSQPLLLLLLHLHLLYLLLLLAGVERCISIRCIIAVAVAIVGLLSCIGCASFQIA